MCIPNICLANEAFVYRMTQNGALACLSHSVFEESNMEPKQGQILVAVAILNRAVNENKHICSIVKAPHQFSFYKAGFNFNKRTEGFSEKIVLDLFTKALQNKLPTYNGITHFHSKSVSPSWASSKQFKLVYSVGQHLFYKEN